MEKMKIEVTSYFTERSISIQSNGAAYNCIIGIGFRPGLEMLFL